MANIRSTGLGKARTQGSNGGPSIDFPQAGEEVRRGHYAVRISGAAGDCQVSIDKGPWQDCRAADGFAWYDWFPEKEGSCTISIRVRAGSGWVKKVRLCTVI